MHLCEHCSLATTKHVKFILGVYKSLLDHDNFFEEGDDRLRHTLDIINTSALWEYMCIRKSWTLAASLLDHIPSSYHSSHGV